MTNYEKIKEYINNVSTDKLAGAILSSSVRGCNLCIHNAHGRNCHQRGEYCCNNGIKKWLESEAVEN